MKKFKKHLNEEKNNKKIDSFLNGTSRIKDSAHKNVIHPKIKVPLNAGYDPYFKPQAPVFMYPSFPQFREYQYKIAIQCVTNNTLVCLPTGLGKTHIASVIISNFAQWFPEGKIFFLAPTRPLVDQQSCSLCRFKKFVKQKEIFVVTGKISANKRISMYKEKKIFFCTPQTFENDLKEGRLQAHKVVLVIFDQAHRTVGDYAYCKIVKLMDKEKVGYRIVGLSATPGNCNEKIQQVLENLQAAKMVVKNEDDPDVSPYIMTRNIKEVIIKASEIILETQNILSEFLQFPMKIMKKFPFFPTFLAGGKYGLTPGGLFMIRKHIEENKMQIKHQQRRVVYDTLSYINFLVQAKQCLRQAGYESFKKKFVYIISDLEALDREKEENEETLFTSILSTEKEKKPIPLVYWTQLKTTKGLKRIKQLFEKRVNMAAHPKIQKLKHLLVQFFNDEKNIKNSSKVIIFAQLRATCYEIKHYINSEKSIKSELFFGQAKTEVQTREGEESITETLQLSQRQQKRVIERYKKNEINTLISTSIGEEGLDIGEVDAIFCYDGGMSVIRMIQRMGRTGRKRNGSVYMLLMDGKQYDDYLKTVKKSQVLKRMKKNEFKFYSFNPSLFEECTSIPIEFYDAQKEESQEVVEKNITKPKLKEIKEKDEEGKITKKKSKNSEKSESLSQLQKFNEFKEQEDRYTFHSGEDWQTQLQQQFQESFSKFSDFSIQNSASGTLNFEKQFELEKQTVQQEDKEESQQQINQKSQQQSEEKDKQQSKEKKQQQTKEESSQNDSEDTEEVLRMLVEERRNK